MTGTHTNTAGDGDGMKGSRRRARKAFCGPAIASAQMAIASDGDR